MSPTANAAPPLRFDVGWRLSVMMFLQYAIWGAWLPLLWPFLSGHRGFEGSEIGDMFAVGAIGAIVSAPLAGQVCDRWVSTERFLGVSHILGGILVWQLASIETYWGFLAFSVAYSLIYAPTLSLTNSLAFHHMPDRDRDFGRVRVWGTIGWIVAGISIGQWLLYQHTPSGPDVTNEIVQNEQWAGMADAFRLSAVLGILMGLFCFVLPSTPPQKGDRKSATLEALSEFKRQPLLMLILLTLPIACIHQFYFVHTAPFLGQFQLEAADEIVSSVNRIFGVGGGGLMTIGQMSEIAVLAGIPLVAKRVSRKALLAAGVVAYTLRMALFAYVDSIPVPPILTLILGVAMHGFCFGCFIFVGFMIVDEETTGDVRASAQSLFNVLVIGLGIILGSKIAGWVAEWAGSTGTMDYSRLFGVPMWGSLVCLAALLALYPAGPGGPGGRRREAA